MKPCIPLTVALFALLMASQAHAATLDQTLDAIRTVESGGKDKTGDNGAAIGPYQIHKDYWTDSGVAGKYEDCHNEAYARQVVIAYMKRYCPTAMKDLNNVNVETLVRVHNGGPSGAKKTATLGYWIKVKKCL